MSLTKLLVGLVGGAAALACIGVTVVLAVFRGGIAQIDRMTNENPAAVAAAAAEIAEFDVPAGYHPDYTARLLEYTVVAYRPDDEHCHLMLVQAPAGTEVEELRAAIKDAEVTPASVRIRTEDVVVDTPEITIAGQVVRAVVGEGVSGDGVAYRQISAVFDGLGGPTLVTMTEPQSRWDWDQVNGFLASIR